MRISDWSSDVCSSDLPALLGNDGADFCAVALQRAGNPIADPRQDEHLAVLERREGAAVVEEAADLRTKAPRLFFNRGPSFLVDVVGRLVAVEQADLAEIGQMPVEMPDVALQLFVPVRSEERPVGKGL